MTSVSGATRTVAVGDARVEIELDVHVGLDGPDPVKLQDAFAKNQPIQFYGYEFQIQEFAWKVLDNDEVHAEALVVGHVPDEKLQNFLSGVGSEKDDAFAQRQRDAREERERQAREANASLGTLEDLA